MSAGAAPVVFVILLVVGGGPVDGHGVAVGRCGRIGPDHGARPEDAVPQHMDRAHEPLALGDRCRWRRGRLTRRRRHRRLDPLHLGRQKHWCTAAPHHGRQARSDRRDTTGLSHTYARGGAGQRRARHRTGRATGWPGWRHRSAGPTTGSARRGTLASPPPSPSPHVRQGSIGPSRLASKRARTKIIPLGGADRAVLGRVGRRECAQQVAK
jgi:hypothetical protein